MYYTTSSFSEGNCHPHATSCSYPMYRFNWGNINFLPPYRAILSLEHGITVFCAEMFNLYFCAIWLCIRWQLFLLFVQFVYDL